MAEESGKVDLQVDLRDGLSAKVDEMSKHVKIFSGLFDHVKKQAIGFAAVVAAGFTVSRIANFLKESREEAIKLDQVQANLKNTMQNMGTYSESAFNKAIEGSRKLRDQSPFTLDRIIELKAELGTLGNIGEDSMNRLVQASADMAAKFHIDLLQSGKMLERTFNNPEYAVFLSRELAIPPATMDRLKKLASKGGPVGEAAARMELLAIAEAKVGRAAKDISDKDPLAKFNNSVSDLKDEVGKIVVELVNAFMPVIVDIVDKTKEIVHWFHEHEKAAKALGIAIFIAGGLFIGYEIAIKAAAVWTGITTGVTWLLTEGVTALSVAMAFLAANPIIIIIAALVALGTAIYKGYTEVGKFHATIWGLWEGLKAFGNFLITGPVQIFYLMGKAISDIFHPDKIAADFDAMKKVIYDGAVHIGERFQAGYQEGMADFNVMTAGSLMPKLEDHVYGTGGKVGEGDVKAIVPPKTKAAGSKSVTINVTIKDLIGTYTSKITNVKEGMNELKNLVVSVMTDAVNDFQHVAEH